MAEKITFSSTNPGMLDFPVWADNKEVALRNDGKLEEADEVRATLTAKKAAEQAAGWAPISINGYEYVVPTSESPSTPEYEALWAEWMAAFDIQITIQQV